MATIKKAFTDEVLEESGTETYDPWKDMRDVYLPRAQTGDEQTMFVSVNDYIALLPYGKKSTVPKPVYDVLMQRFEAEERLMQTEAEIPNKAPGQN